jgi:hypothetical protein
VIPDPEVALTVTELPDTQPPQLVADEVFVPRPTQFLDGTPTADSHIV